jgi:hypothetical protein
MHIRLLPLISAVLLFAVSLVPIDASASYSETFDYTSATFNYWGPSQASWNNFGGAGTYLTYALTITDPNVSSFTGFSGTLYANASSNTGNFNPFTAWTFTYGAVTDSSSQTGSSLNTSDHTDYVTFTNGKITSWNLNFTATANATYGNTGLVSEYVAGSYTYGDEAIANNGAQSAEVSPYTEGTFSPAAAAPIPGTVLLLGPGLVGLAGLRRKFNI